MHRAYFSIQQTQKKTSFITQYCVYKNFIEAKRQHTFIVCEKIKQKKCVSNNIVT